VRVEGTGGSTKRSDYNDSEADPNHHPAIHLEPNEIAEALLKKNRALAEDSLKVARDRYRGATATQVDVLRAEVAISDINRELENTAQAVNEARAELARLLHVRPETPLRTLPDLSVGYPFPRRSGGSINWSVPAAPSSRGGSPPSPATRRPSSWHENDITPTLRLDWSIRTWRRPMPWRPGRPRGSPTSGCLSV